MSFSDTINSIKRQALDQAQPYFTVIDEIAEINTKKVLDVFRNNRVSDYHFGTTTGYAYSDGGRDTLDKVWADICGAEKAIFRTQFVSGTHALATVLFGILRPGDNLVSIAGAP